VDGGGGYTVLVLVSVLFFFCDFYFSSVFRLLLFNLCRSSCFFFVFFSFVFVSCLLFLPSAYPSGHVAATLAGTRAAPCWCCREPSRWWRSLFLVAGQSRCPAGAVSRMYPAGCTIRPDVMGISSCWPARLDHHRLSAIRPTRRAGPGRVAAPHDEVPPGACFHRLKFRRQPNPRGAAFVTTEVRQS